MEFETFNKTQNEYSKKLKEYFSWLNEKVFLISMMTYDNEETSVSCTSYNQSSGGTACVGDVCRSVSA